jgi:hypothetical protein
VGWEPYWVVLSGHAAAAPVPAAAITVPTSAVILDTPIPAAASATAAVAATATAATTAAASPTPIASVMEVAAAHSAAKKALWRRAIDKFTPDQASNGYL